MPEDDNDAALRSEVHKAVETAKAALKRYDDKKQQKIITIPKTITIAVPTAAPISKEA